MIKNIFTILAIIMIIDFMGFVAWGVTKQNPVDEFYIGAITNSIVR